MSAEQGRGRGFFIRQLESGYSTDLKTEDDRSKKSPAQPPVGGRGKFMQILQRATASPSTGSSATDSGVAGRGQLLTQLRGNIAIESRTSSDDVDHCAPKISPRAAGRGQMLAMLRTGHGESAITTSSDEQRPPTIGRGRLLELAAHHSSDASAEATTSSMSKLYIESNVSSEYRKKDFKVTKIPDEDEVIEEVNEDDEKIFKKMGHKGEKLEGLTNFIKLKMEPERGIFEYEVRFDPNIHSQDLRHSLLSSKQDVLGNTRTFDGTVLCLPQKLQERITKVTSLHPSDGTDVKITIIFKRRRGFSEYPQFFGILFHRIMRVLKFVQHKNKSFDPADPKIIPQHKLEVWPGFVTSVEDCDGGVILCVDVASRVLRQERVLETMQHAFQSSRGNMDQYKASISKALLGSIVITRYNNKTYRIDDIDFNQTPMSTFKCKDREATYVEYYRTNYSLEIRDVKQPLLISHSERRISGQKEKETTTLCLIPELCYLTGLTDQQRADFKVMRDLATYTRVSPEVRNAELKKFCARVNGTPAAKSLLSVWGLELASEPLKLTMRQMIEEKVGFGNGKEFPVGVGADFNRHIGNNPCMQAIDLLKWILVYVRSDEKTANIFCDTLKRNTRPMGINYTQPKMIAINDDRTETYADVLRRSITPDVQIVVVLCPTSRDDRYAVIKKICNSEAPIPSQVINSRTLRNEQKNRGIVQKIALQMNCKMGGSLWSIKIPMDSTMIIGVDTYHEAKSKSVSAFVASLSRDYTKWYSRAIIQERNEELAHGMVVSLRAALASYMKENNHYPSRIILFRDGVGDSQLPLCKEYELKQMKDACKAVDEKYQPKFTFVVVQKRINARIFTLDANNKAQNPNPGVVLDHSVTRRQLYDFYLVPQSVRQGTVTPTHYIVVEDESNFEADILQRLSYKLCFLYYNWPGTVRVPACCQYAHKLAALVGSAMKREPSEKLADKLYYL